MAAELRRAQTFPIYYAGESRFTTDGQPGSQASGLVGSTANITITINTRPHGFTGLRIRNVYPIPSAALAEPYDSYFPSWADIKLLDSDQDVEVNLAEQNVVVKRADQGAMLGGGATSYVWHPFACPYPFRGGNNINIIVKRTVSYPLIVGPDETPVQGIFPVCKVVLVGYAYVTGQQEEGGPPSTDWPGVAGT
jgi:hypothetical protein